MRLIIKNVDGVFFLQASTKQQTVKINPLSTVKNIGLSGLQLKQSNIPINPLKLVGVCVTITSPNFNVLLQFDLFFPPQFGNGLLFGLQNSPPESHQETS